jgi:hypothetical protein
MIMLFLLLQVYKYKFYKFKIAQLYNQYSTELPSQQWVFWLLKMVIPPANIWHLAFGTTGAGSPSHRADATNSGAASESWSHWSSNEVPSGNLT